MVYPLTLVCKCCNVWPSSFSELVPLFLRIVIGIPQMLSKTQMILICIVVRDEPPRHLRVTHAKGHS